VRPFESIFRGNGKGIKFQEIEIGIFQDIKLLFGKIDKEVEIIANYQEIEKALGALRGLD
jgi:hypothetical protein